MNNTEVSEIVVKQEFVKSTDRNHLIVCWVGMALNLFWFISDYFTVPQYFLPFLYFRLTVSAITVALLFLREQLKISIVFCGFLLVLGISLQNAYMWSVMSLPQVQKHAFAYMVLFIGVGMLILWEIRYSLAVVFFTLITNVVFYVCNSTVPLEDFLIGGGLLVFTVLIFSVFLIRNRYSLTYKEIKSRLELEKSKSVIQYQKDEVEEVNREMTSSMRYARRIQDSLLPPLETLDNLFDKNYFIYYKPKDIVSGDFYWAASVKTSGEGQIGLSLAAVVDCTGHGVPGAFLSIVGSDFLKQSLKEPTVNTVAEALDYLNQKVIANLNQNSNTESRVRDGMDIALIAIDYDRHLLYYSGANNPAYIFRPSPHPQEPELHVLTPTKQAIGAVVETVQHYHQHQFDFQKGDIVYLFSDGFPDQFGGDKNKKYNYKRFKEFLGSICQLPMGEQRKMLEKEFEQWRGNNEQTDDVCIMGIKF